MLRVLEPQLQQKSRSEKREYIEKRWEDWRETERERASKLDDDGRIMNAFIFSALSDIIPDEVVIAVDVGNNTYSFGRYFESRKHDLIMSGYLGSVGF